jgi:hypothetical protein
MHRGMRTSNDNLAFEITLFNPFYRLLQFCITTLVCEVAGVYQDVACGQFGRVVVRVRYANYPRLACF